MKKLINSFPYFIFFLGLVVFTASCERNEEELSYTPEVKPNESRLKCTNIEKLRHLMLFQFNDNATKENIDGFVKGLCAFKDSIQEVKGLEWGVNFNSKYNNQYSYCFLLTFYSMEDFLLYLNHPVHINFINTWLYPNIKDFMAFDYWANSVNGHENPWNNKIIRHIALFNVGDSPFAFSGKDITKPYSKLTARIHGIQSLEWGEEMQLLGLNKGFDYIFSFTFKSPMQCHSYNRNPAKQYFFGNLIPNPVDILEVEYFIK